jgi:molybdate transport system permease protein
MGSLSFSVLLSFKVALVATLFVVIVGTFFGYILAVKSFPGKTLLDVILTLPLVLPPTVTGYYLIVLFGRNGVLGAKIYALTGWTIMFTWQGAVVASFIVALPLMVKTARASIESIDRNLINSAVVMGYTRWEVFIKVILPLAKKGLFAGTILSFARAMGEFGATLMVAGNIPGKTDTMPLAIYSKAASGEWSSAHIMVILFTGVSALFLYLAIWFTGKKQ